MSGTHAHTADAQADVQRADVQGRKPNIPPGHVETERPIRRLSAGQTLPVIGVGAVVIAAVIGIAVLVV